ncbi:hypothetical protein F1B92_02765 [Campylobacter sp. FMV-PI01]|uniref:Uncharacterized protein n=1 Tax=Campylobacter portucalensis TaxID=2608384 RepID=A0A6L5WH04_9BACT|nr:hypothetical protein [Campylobacter portucalensis]MSN96126.1 hypothetical protein [Campylobacter portucalensis]
MKFGFIFGGREFIPEIFNSYSRYEIRLFFIIFYNFCVDKELKIPLIFAKKAKNLEEIFTLYIDFLLKSHSLQNNKTIKFCPISNFIVKNYGKNINQIVLQSPKFRVAKFIKMIFFKENPGLIFDSEFLFKNYVFSKILLKHSNNGIVIKDEMIRLNKKDGTHLCVIPCFLKFDLNKKALNDKIEQAFDLSSGSREIYLVLPKQNGFCKHISVNSCSILDGNKTIKLVPYSITNKIIQRN